MNKTNTKYTSFRIFNNNHYNNYVKLYFSYENMSNHCMANMNALNINSPQNNRHQKVTLEAQKGTVYELITK